MSNEEKFKEESRKDSPIVLKVKRKDSFLAEQLHSYRVPLQKPSSASNSLRKSSSKSADSLDSGIYSSRQKSIDSMDSLDSNESGCNGEGVTPGYTGLSPSDESLPSLPMQQYEDYLREVQDIRQSIVVKNREEEKQPISRTNSGDDADDESETEWLRLAGLSDLVMTPSNTMMTSGRGSMVSRVSTDLSSMTVLSTLTRPQREAVLRRITSFNRAQKTKKRPKPTITSIFPTVDVSPENSPDSPKEPIADSLQSSKKPKELPLESLTLQPEDNFGDINYRRRFSETPRTNAVVTPTEGVLTPEEPDHVQPKMDNWPKQKKNMDGIIPRDATGEPSMNASYLTMELPHKRGNQLLSNLEVSPSLSMPELNTVEFNAQTTEVIKSSSTTMTLSASTENLLRQFPSPSKRLNPVAADRKIKALSDIPLIQSHFNDFPSSCTPRLMLESKEVKKEKKLKKSRSLKEKAISSLRSLLNGNREVSPRRLSTRKSSKGSLSPTPARNQPVIIKRTAAPLPSRNVVTNSPELKHRFLLSPTLSIKSLKRRSPSNSPLKARKFSNTTSPPPMPSPSKTSPGHSPLHKLSSSMSFLTLRSPPKRTGSYKIKSAATSHRRTLRRARSLKVRSKRPVSLVSLKMSGDAPQFNSNAPSIETLSISSKSDSSSFRGSREEISMHFGEEQGKVGKSMSYSETAKQESLPNFSLVRDRLGITKISDLSPVDMRKVQSLALIELTALFDLRNIELKRRKLGKTKYKDQGVFGTPITVLVDWDRKRTNYPDLRVPQVLSEIISFLETNALQDEGILRKSGSAARTKMLKQDLETRFGPNATASMAAESQVWNEVYSHDVAALLKQFFRELPDPLLTTEYIDAFQSCGLITDRKEQLQALNLLIILLHETHRDSLKLLLKFLHQVVMNEATNKMSLNNVAMITAPNLFISGRKSKKENTTSQDLKHAAGTSNIVCMLIKYHKLLWTVPAFMLTQVRHMNRAEMSSKKHQHLTKEKSKYKFFAGGKKDPSRKQLSIQTMPQPFDYETPKGLLRVQAPNMKLTSMAVQLDAELTAGNIISKYQRQCGRMNQNGADVYAEVTSLTHALYEVGGNIHERCLDPDTNMNALIKVNPEAFWFLRPRSKT